MDSEFLKEYEIRDNEAIQRTHDISKRLGKLQSPVISIADIGPSIWSQIAFSGTAICPISPMTQNQFENEWNISASNFPDLIHFVKDTKKIQFVLTAPPTYYEKCEYLEPIFQELAPPQYSINFDLQNNEKLKSLIQFSNEEINYLISISPQWGVHLKSNMGPTQIREIIQVYSLLRYYDFNDIADRFIDNFLINPRFSHDYILMAHQLLIHPKVDPLKANLSLTSKDIQMAKELEFMLDFKSNTPVLPEIGSFLMKKCTYYPESLDACKDLVSKYQKNDLYEVYAALNNAIINTNDQLIFQKTQGLEEILDSIWTDDTISQNTKCYSAGIIVACGLVGLHLGGTPGFLESIGIHVLDSVKSKYLEQFSELISKKTASPSLVTVHDFKKRYHIPS